MAEPTTSGEDSDGPSSGSAWRSTGFLVAAGFVVFVVIAAVVVVAIGGSGDAPPPAAGTAPPTAPPDTSARETSPPRGRKCAPSDTDQQVPTSPPEGVTWSLFHGIAVPASKAAGPMIVSPGGMARCYAHTPTGALVAVCQISARIALAPEWQTVVEAQVMPGPGRDHYISRRAKLTGTPRQTGYAQFVAFHFVTYTPRTAVIQLVSQAAHGGMGVHTMTVTWDGDWKLRMQNDGSFNPPPQPVTSLNGYVPWGGI